MRANSQAASGDGQYVVVARRYRPQGFGELIGQEHVARGLSSAITSNRVGHAYLFTGARGVGKTSTARILAKALNCVHGPTPTPCNECDICTSISAGEDVDVLEIDGASNRGIDEIRQLRQNVNVRPSRARYKIYIIDEVHMLTREAFNALLKTLEEPPEHVKFIFCTTEAEKIPITILSRCQRFDFAGIQAPSIVERLRQIAEAEGVEAEREALEVLARRAAGSMRDSQSLLEQLLAFGGDKITAADVHEMFGTASGARLAKIARCLVDRDAAAILAELDSAVAEGVDVGQFLDQLLGYLRDCMAAAVGCSADNFLHVSSSEVPELKQASERLGLETILAMIQILDQTLSRLRYSSHARTLSEMALVRMCRLEDLQALPGLIAELRSGAQQSDSSGSGSAALEAKKKAPALAADNPPLTPSPVQTGTESNRSGDTARVSTPDLSAPRISVDSESISAVWNEALNRLGDITAEMARFATVELSTRQPLASSGPTQLVATFPAKYNSCKTFCEKHAAELEQALAATAGQQIRIQFKVADDVPADAAPIAARKRSASKQQRMAEKSQHPLVSRAMELFDARAVRLDEPEETAT